MRKIKFRAWDLLSESYIYLNDKLCSVPYYEIFNHTPDSRPWIAEQYTGLKDKNDKEIYEGDIVFSSQWHPKYQQVVFDRGGFCLKVDNSGYYPDIKYAEQMEVAGNIHENKDLL